MKFDITKQLTQMIEKDSLNVETFTLTGSGTDAILIRPNYTGFVSYQVSDTGSTLSGGLTINLEMSNDGQTWTAATDAVGEVITHSLAAGASILEKLSDVNPAIKLRLVFASAVTGVLLISTRI